MTSAGRSGVLTRIVCGPPASGKTGRLLKAYADCVKDGQWDAALYLVPTVRVADLVRGRLCDAGLRGLFDFRVMTFAEAADALLVANHVSVAAISDLQQHCIVRRVLERLSDTELGPLASQRAGPGLVMCLVEDINELKAAGVEPAELLAALSGEGVSDPVALATARVYQCYQDFLQANLPQLFDGPGMLWHASQQLDKAMEDPREARPFDTARLVLADGFSDFTTVELRMLARLAAVAGECIVSLTCEIGQEDTRPELEAIPRRTLAALKQHLGSIGQVEVERLSPAEPAETDLAYLRRYMFDRSVGPRDGGTSGRSCDGSVTVMQAPGLWAEVRMVAREIKRLVDPTAPDRVSPGQIGIIARSLDEYRLALRQVFAEYGLPLFVAGGEPVADRPCVRFVNDLLRLIEEDYPRVATVAVLDAAWDKLLAYKAGRGVVSLADYVSRQAGITRGAKTWEERIEALVERLSARLSAAEAGWDEEYAEDQADDAFRSYVSLDEERRLRDAAVAVLEAFRGLRNLLAPLSLEGSRAELTDRLLDTLSALGVGERLDVPGNVSETGANRRAWEALLAALEAYADSDRHLVSGEPQVVKPEVFAAEVRELLGDLRAPSHGRGEGKILALDVHGALQVSFDTVFLLGLTEGSFPRRAHGDPLLSDALRARLARRGLPVRLRISEADEEAYLFQLAVSAANHRLYLCYSDTDAAGQPVLRSYYLDEAERLLPALKTVGQGLRRLRLRDVVPTLCNVGSYRELAERALWLCYNADGAADAPWRKDAEHLLASTDGTFGHAATAAQVERLRSGWTRTGPRLSDQPPLGVYDGDLGEVEAVLRELNRRFGPTAIFSASSLGKYGHCPMSFMFERLLGIEELPEPAAELEPANLGLLVHTTLARFYSDRVQAGKGRVSEEEVELARSEVLEAAEKTFRKFESCGRTGHELLWPLTKEAVRKKLCIWVEAEANALTELVLTDLQPCFFEHSYGNEPDNALVLETQQVGPVRVRGRIDRIDLVGDDGFFLFDYKTGRTVPESRDILEGRDLQMPLYALAGERLLFHGQDGPSRICKGWAYVRVGWPAKGTAEKVFEKTKRDYGPGERARKWSFQELIDESIEWVGRHVANIRQGRFTWPQTCPKGPSYHCPYEFLCRYEFRKALRRRMAEELTAGVEDGSNDDGG